MMIWAGVSFSHCTEIEIVLSSGLNSVRYIEILNQHVFPMHDRIGRGFLLMQENAHPHTAQNIRRFLRLNDITTH